jgi:hypothetical protein
VGIEGRDVLLADANAAVIRLDLMRASYLEFTMSIGQQYGQEQPEHIITAIRGRQSAVW